MFNFIFQKLHKEGYRFVAIAAAITFIFLLINNYLGLIGLVFTIWCIYPFNRLRDVEIAVNRNLVCQICRNQRLVVCVSIH